MGPKVHTSIILAFSAQRSYLGGSFFVKMSNFFVFSSEKDLYLLRSQNQIVKCYTIYRYQLSSNCVCLIYQSVLGKMVFKYGFKNFFFSKINFFKNIYIFNMSHSFRILCLQDSH